MVGVSDYLMVSLAKLTVKVGREAGKVVANSDVRTCMYMYNVCVCTCEVVIWSTALFIIMKY